MVFSMQDLGELSHSSVLDFVVSNLGNTENYLFSECKVAIPLELELILYTLLS